MILRDKKDWNWILWERLDLERNSTFRFLWQGRQNIWASIWNTELRGQKMRTFSSAYFGFLREMRPSSKERRECRGGRRKVKV